MLLVAACAFGLGWIVAFRVRRIGRASLLVRRVHRIGVQAIDVLSLLVFGWILYDLEWSRVIRAGFRLGDPILLDDALVLLPFLLAQLAGWWGLYAAEQALRPLSTSGRASTVSLAQGEAIAGDGPARGRDLRAGLGSGPSCWPATTSSPWDQTVSLALMGFLVLALAPLFVRIAWPTRSLPPGRFATGSNTWRIASDSDAPTSSSGTRTS